MEREIEKSRRWTSFLKRLRGVVDEAASNTLKNNRNGVCIVNLHVAVDSEGTPLVWVVGKTARIEPSNNARAVLLALLGDSGEVL